MSEEMARAFERVSGWREYGEFERDQEGYITNERVGDALCFFLWRVDKDPARLDHFFMDGKIFVRFGDNFH